MPGQRHSTILKTLALGVALAAVGSLTSFAEDDLNFDIPAETADTPDTPAAASDQPAEAPPPATKTETASVDPTAAVGLPDDVTVPTDPVAKAAFDMLEKHCSRCHQEGMLGDRLKPAKGFGFILKLDQLAADPHYVVPGNPDASKIVQMILNKEMPYDVNYLFDSTKPKVTDQDLLALRTWITSLGESQTAACSERHFITPADMVSAMAADLDQLDPTRVADTRYITLSELYNACATDEEMKVYRQGVVKLLNSLSSVSDVVRLETVDEAGTIIRFNLKDLGWQPEDWDQVLAVYPYAVRPDTQMFDLLSAATLTPLPYVRGDWFAFTAAQPPLYDNLLHLADSFQGLEHELGFDVGRDIDSFTVKRAGFQHSGVSENNRMIERHTISTGYLWTSYDFSGNRGRQSFFEFPLGPGDGKFAFKHQGGETIFSLPNGFQGYYLNKADGTKLDKGPTEIVRDLSRRDLTVTNGISCMGCHDQGIRKAKDEVREHVLSNRSFPKSVQDAVAALYPPVEEMDKVLAEDTARFHEAMTEAGLDPTLKLNGVEMINALAKRYENDVELGLAAAEFGEDPDTFKDAVASSGDGPSVRLGRRLEQGLVPRDLFETEYPDVVTRVSDLIPVDLGNVPVTPVHTVTVAPPTIDLALISDRSSYRVNDLPVFTVTTSHDCFLTLIDVDGTGKAVVIFPNKFQRDNHLKANADLKFPADDAPFQFRFADPGTETVIAVCNLHDKPVDNINVDYAQVFTDLGDYTKHLTRSIKVEERPTKATAVVTPESGPTLARAAIKMKVR